MLIKIKFQKLVRRYFWGMDIAPSAFIHPDAHIDRTWPKGIHIAENARIAKDASILAHDMTRGLYLDTRIGVGAIIGVRSIVMPGVTIGDGAVVAPGAIVTRDVPDRHMAEGNPAATRPLDASI